MIVAPKISWLSLVGVAVLADVIGCTVIGMFLNSHLIEASLRLSEEPAPIVTPAAVSDPNATPGLAKLLADFEAAKDSSAKELILCEITSNYPDAAGTPLLGIAIRTADDTTKWMACRGLGELKHEPAIPMLIQWLQSDDAFVRSNAARALGDIGEGRKIAADDLKWNMAKRALVELLDREHDDGVLEQTSPFPC